jgi:hypothetical protein
MALNLLWCRYLPIEASGAYDYIHLTLLTIFGLNAVRMHFLNAGGDEINIVFDQCFEVLGIQ